MDDIKELRSSLDARMDELRDLILQLTKPKESTESSPKDADDLDTSSDKVGEDEENDPTKKSKDDKDASSSSHENGEKKDYHSVSWLSPDSPVPHPHTNNREDPPKLDAINFGQWQSQIKSHICSSSNELWRIIENGFKAVDPSNPTRREVVDGQLNATALHMIQITVGAKD